MKGLLKGLKGKAASMALRRHFAATRNAILTRRAMARDVHNTFEKPYNIGRFECTEWKHEYLRRQVLLWAVSKFMQNVTRVRPDGVHCADCRFLLASKEEIVKRER